MATVARNISHTKVLLGDSSTSLSIGLLSNITQGKGAHLPHLIVNAIHFPAFICNSDTIAVLGIIRSVLRNHIADSRFLWSCSRFTSNWQQVVVVNGYFLIQGFADDRYTDITFVRPLR